MKHFMFLLLLSLMACTSRDMTPEKALREYVEGSIGHHVDREFVLQRVTGKLQQVVTNMSDEDFLVFANLSSLRPEGFNVLSKSCQSDRCFLTYTVSYQKLKEDQKSFKTEVKKIAEIQQVNGKWLIADVSNIKTYLEALEPINPLDE